MGFFNEDLVCFAATFAVVAFLAGAGLAFLATGLARALPAGLVAGLVFTAGRGGAFLATALTGLAGVAALPAFLATGLALVTAAPFLVLAVGMQGLLRVWPPPMGGLTTCWLGVQS